MKHERQNMTHSAEGTIHYFCKRSGQLIMFSVVYYTKFVWSVYYNICSHIDRVEAEYVLAISIRKPEGINCIQILFGWTK